MSSPGLLRALLRTSSSAPERNPDSPSPKISTSPSFSDFSCNVGADFDDVDLTSNATATPRSFDGRASMESVDSRTSTPSAYNRRSMDASSLRADMRGLLFGSKASPGLFEYSQPLMLKRAINDGAGQSNAASLSSAVVGRRNAMGHDDLRRASVPNPAGFQRDAIMNHQQAKPATAAQPMAPEKARRKQKIDGMEFYEWAELIRSSSL